MSVKRTEAEQVFYQKVRVLSKLYAGGCKTEKDLQSLDLVEMMKIRKITVPELIRAFFEEYHSDAERIEFVQSLFNNDFTEIILDDGRRMGYKTYENVLHLWEGKYTDRKAEGYYDWGVIASHFDGMRLLGELQDNLKPLPSMEGQQLALQKAEEKTSAFAFSQEIIDRVLTNGSGFSQGKLRIHEQFQKSLSSKENAEFLKNEYGWGGSSPVIGGTDISEMHDGKGIHLTMGNLTTPDTKVTLKWTQVEKRIAELIRLDRYLNPKEMELYPQWLTEQEEKRRETEERRANRETMSTAPSEKEQAEETPAHYEYHLGDKVYLGAQEFEILSFDENRVMLYDPSFPLFNREEKRADFDRMVMENPMNDHLKVYEVQPENGSITLHRVGDFYEMLGEEAETAAKVLDLTLTARQIDGERVPMCGIPFHVHDSYVERLKRAGYSVTTVEESAPASEKVAQMVDQQVEPAADPLMEQAKKLIEEYIESEFGDDAVADFSDMTDIGVAYTTTEDDKHEVQVSVDLEHLKINTFVDNTLANSVQYARSKVSPSTAFQTKLTKWTTAQCATRQRAGSSRL